MLSSVVALKLILALVFFTRSDDDSPKVRLRLCDDLRLRDVREVVLALALTFEGAVVVVVARRSRER